MSVDNKPGYFVAVIVDDRFVQKGPKRHLRQRHLRRDALLIVGGGQTGQLVARVQRSSLGH